MNNKSVIRSAFYHAIGLCLLLLPSVRAWAQPTVQDCQGAIRVCDWKFQQASPFSGTGNVPNEINPSISCLGTGEKNSVWYTFTTQSGGDVNFTIRPNNPSNDYDWAVYNLSNAACSDIFTNPALLTACNFSAIPGPTGANNGPLPQNTSVISVQAKETYVIIITNYSPTNQEGYELDFSASTAQIFDNIPPNMLGVQEPIRCNTDTISVRFNENVACSQVNAGTFVLTGPDGVHTINSVSSPDCAVGASSSSRFILKFSPELTANGAYTITLASAVSDMCGNTLNPADAAPLNFNYAGLIVDSTFSTLADCLQNNGSAGIAVTGGVLPLTYSWSPGGQTTPIATNLYAGNYTVTVMDQNNCRMIETVTVSNPINFAVSFVQVPDTCQKGNGSVTVTANGTSGPFAYQWNLPSGANQQTQYPVRGNDELTVNVTDVDGCVIHDTVIVANINNDSLLAAFTATPNPVDILFPESKLVNGSQYYDSYKWMIFGEPVTNNPNPVLKFPDWGDYPVQLFVYDKNGCADTTEMVIQVRGNLYYYIPNAFTPDENNLNDTWRPRGVGFDEKSYQLTIFDRWWNVIYMSQFNDEAGWNGRDQKGQPCPNGMYIYKITMEGYEGALPVFIGELTLIK